MAASQAFKDYIVRYRRGERVYSEGDPGTEMYIVQNGSVEIFKEAAGSRISLAVMEKGDFFGEMALIESTPHSSSAEAGEDCELIEINSTLFDKMIKGNIEIAVRMLRKLSIRLREATARLEELAVSQASQGASVGEGGTRPEPLTEAGTAADVPPRPPAEAMTVPDGHETISFEREAAPQADHPKAGAADCLAVFLSEAGEELFRLSGDRAVIGRFDPVTGLRPEVDLSAIDLNRSVSRHHARLTLDRDTYSITEEVGALNGTFVNGKQLVSGKACRLGDGDVVNLGMVKLIFRKVAP